MVLHKKNITKIASLFVIIAGGLTAAGWLFDISAFNSLVPGLATMKFNTGVCFILAGIALYYSDTPDTDSFARTVVIGASILLGIIAILTLTEYITGNDLGIDTLVKTQRDGILISHKMTSTTATIFLLIAVSMIFLRKKKFHLTLQIILVLVLLIAIFTILGNIVRKEYLSGGLGTYYRMAFHAGLSFTVLCIGIFYSSPLGYLKFSYQKKITSYLSIFVFFLVVMFFLFNRNNKQFNDSTRLQEHVNTILLQSQQVLSLAQDMETGQRGFTITQREEFLEPYNRSLKLIRSSLTELKNLTKDSIVDQHRIDTLTQLVNTKIELNEHIIRSQKEKATSIAFSDEEIRGKRIMDSIRSVITALQLDKNALLQKTRADTQLTRENTYRFTILIQVLLLAMLVAVFFIIYNNTRRRNKAEADLKQNHSELVTEILKREKLQAQLKEFNEGLAQQVAAKTSELTGIFERITDGFIALDNNFVYTYVNKRTGEMTGRDPGSLIGKNIWEEFPDVVGSATYLAFKKAMDEQHYVLNVDYYAPLDLWQENHIYPSPEGLSIFIRDISNQKRGERQLAASIEKTKESEEKYRTIFYKSPLPKWIYDCDTLRFLEVNDAATRHYGYSEEEFLKMTIKDIRPKEDIPMLEQDLTGIDDNNTTRHGTWRHLKKNGELILVETTAHSIDYNDRKARLIICNDVTERQKAQELLAAERTLLRQLIDNLPVYVYLKDKNSRYIICNRPLVEVAGIKSEKEAIGKTVDQLFGPEIGPVNREEDENVFLLGEAALNREETILTPTGERRWLLTSKVPLKDDKNNVEALIGISLDVTEQKHTARLLEELNERLKKRAAELSASNTELERFAYVASHDLQEPLRMVSSFLQLLEKKIEGQLDETSKQYIHYAVDGAERMKKLIQDLLQYSRVGTTTELDSEVNCNEILTAVKNVYELAIHEKKAELIVNPLPVIRGAKTQIQQLFQNLVGNALKYAGTDAPVIEVACEDKGDNWQFYVKDNGIGIESRFFDKIFIIFQRLHNKNQYSGTGIGLSICKKIAERHHGKIWVESEPNKGSTFYISLPK